MNDPKVTVVILNWNGWHDTIECLESLYQITYPNYNVVVADNLSEDNSIEKITEYCEGRIIISSELVKYSSANKPIKTLINQREETPKSEEIVEIENIPSNRKLIIIKNEKNYGFSEGNNIAIRYALKNLNQEYILLLNNDTVVEKDFLKELVKVAESDERIGIVGPKIYYYDYDREKDIIWFAGGKINWRRELVYSHIGQRQKDVGQFDSVKQVDWISGASLMVKTPVIKKSSLLNSKYFFGNEDVELCIKTRKKHYSAIYVPTSKVWHKVSVSRSKMEKQTMNFGDYFYFIKQNFSFLVYAYHIIEFVLVWIPKLIVIHLIKHINR